MDLASNEQKAEPSDELQQLREENARLKALLNSHGIAWEEGPATAPEFLPPATPANSNPPQRQRKDHALSSSVPWSYRRLSDTLAIDQGFGWLFTGLQERMEAWRLPQTKGQMR
jgi:hypothetical protein